MSVMTPEVFIRDFAMYAVIFGFFGMVWFGWAQENPPKSWRVWLGIGSVVSVLLMNAGIYLAITNWSGGTALNSRAAYSAFGITVGVEVATAALGALVLAHLHKLHLISAWIALVVGLHFLPLVWIFKDKWLLLLTMLASAAPIVAILLARKTRMAVSAWVGVSMGVVLVAFAMRGLVLALLG